MENRCWKQDPAHRHYCRVKNMLAVPVSIFLTLHKRLCPAMEKQHETISYLGSKPYPLDNYTCTGFQVLIIYK